LEDIGFTKGEIKVYFALLGMGNTTSGPIISKSAVARSKVYDILEKLKQKGLVSEVIKQNIKYFQAASPERILDYIKIKEKEIKEDESKFKKLLPELLQKQKYTEEKQDVKVYAGFEGIKTFYNEILGQLEKGDEYLAMTFSDESLKHKSIVLHFQKFRQLRAKKGIKAKILCRTKEQLTQKKMNYTATGLYEFRVTGQLIPAGIVIFKDTVATFNWGSNPRVFVIICKENAEHYKRFFYDVWEKAKV